MNNSLAPIILFVYNRPKHTLQTLEALANNELASQSLLFIFSDGYNTSTPEKTITEINEVRSVIRQKKWCGEVIIREAKQNNGLANSVISGVTEIIEKYGKVIVLEDDLLPANFFLNYMNRGLDLYQDKEAVIQIAGFSFPAKKIKAEHSSYFLPMTSTWGWATWKRVWAKVDFTCSDYEILKTDKELAYRFNFNGAYDYKKMFIQQMESNKVSSWGIRFYWNSFKQNALTLFPDKSLILNNGWDSSGSHNDSYNLFPIENWDNDYKITHFPNTIAKKDKYVQLVRKYIKARTSILTKVIHRVSYIFKSI